MTMEVETLRMIRRYLDRVDGESGLTCKEVDVLCGIAWGRIPKEQTNAQEKPNEFKCLLCGIDGSIKDTNEYNIHINQW